jgi:hypothetical protein
VSHGTLRCAGVCADLFLQPGAVPVLNKPVTAELGNITPYIIVPGEWSEGDIEYHATNVASGLTQNTGHNCIAAEVRGAWGVGGTYMHCTAYLEATHPRCCLLGWVLGTHVAFDANLPRCCLFLHSKTC